MGTFVGTSANGGNVTALTTANSAAITWPTVQAGDLAIIAWTFQNTATPTDPTSQTFTLYDQVDDGSCRSRLLYRVCTGSESGTIAGWSNSIPNRQTAVLFVVRGYVSFVATSATEPGTSTTHDCPAIGTGNGAATGDSVIVIGTDRSGLTTTATPPSGWAKRTTSEFGLAASGGTYTGVADDGLTGQTMPVDPGSWTMQSGSTSVTRTLALRPTPVPLGLTASGSVTANGAAALTLTQKLSASGATAEDGTAPLSLNASLSATGSVSTTGSAALSLSAPLSASGAAGTSGSGTLGVQLSLTSTGAVSANGGADLQIIAGPTFTGSGGSTVTGNAALRSSLALTSAGAAVLTGAAALAETSALTAEGSVNSDGSVALTAVRSLTAVGASAGDGSVDLKLFSPITRRPDEGRTDRPLVGVTARPFTGTTPRP